MDIPQCAHDADMEGGDAARIRQALAQEALEIDEREWDMQRSHRHMQRVHDTYVHESYAAAPDRPWVYTRPPPRHVYKGECSFHQGLGY